MISSRFTALPAAAIALAAAACGGGSGARDATVGDATVGDATIGDATVGDATLGDATLGDATVGDGAREDASLDDAAPLDAAPLDAAPLDAAPLDAAPLDAAPLDAAPLDAAPLDAAPAPPCASGPGRVLWRLSFPPNHGGYATVDAWAAACAYSLADPACSLSGEPHDYASFGPGVVFNSTTDYFRVRWSVAGMAFTQATLYLAAHADGGGLPRLAIQSQLHGDFLFQPTVPISTHRLYAIDWTPYLTPADAPSLTAITLRPMPTGVAVSLLELCVQ